MTTNTTRTMTMSWLLILLTGCSTDTREQVDMWEVGERHPDMLRTTDMSVMTEDRGMLDTGGEEDLSEVDQPVDMPAWSTPEGMVNIPQGAFTMGSSFEENESAVRDREYPPHEVWLSRYAMDQYEVTVAQYTECVEQGACEEPPATQRPTEKEEWCNYGHVDRANQPINCVDWERANAFCEWAGKKLPTEAQWEKAARGPESFKYSWGNAPEPSCTLAALTNCGRETTWDVGMHPEDVSTYGVFDLMGNVYEWTRYPFYEYPEDAAPLTNPPQNTDTSFENEVAVARGSSMELMFGTLMVRAASRRRTVPNFVSAYQGFRCVYEGPETSP